MAMRALRSLQIGLPLSRSGGAENLKERSQNERSSSEISGAPAARQLAWPSWSYLKQLPGLHSPFSRAQEHDIQVRAFGYKLAHDLGKFLSDYNVAPFVRSWDFAALVLESFGGSQAESSNQTTTCGVFDFRSFPTKPMRTPLSTLFII